MEEIHLGTLPTHLIDQIFSLVPLKSRTRLKSVSRDWHSFLTRLRHSNPPTTSSGLVIFLKGIGGDEVLHQSTFIKLHDQQKSYSLYASPSLHKFPCWLIDSCNGLLLYATSGCDSWTFHVSVPFTSRFTSLPPAHKVSRSSCVSLAFNGLQFSSFRVLCFFWDEFDVASGTMNHLCFSSQSWSWKEQQARLMNSQLLLEEDFIRGQCFRPNVYMKGKLYWLWSKFMLVYDENKEFFNLIRLPINKSKRTIPHLSQLLWQSEGRIHFCYPYDGGLYLWEYTGDEDDCDHKTVTCHSKYWRFKKLIVLDDLKLLNSELEYQVNDAEKQRIFQLSWTSSIRPCAFNEDLQVLYLLALPGNIVSYSFETQRFARIWSFGQSGDHNYLLFNVYPFLYNSQGI